MANIGECVAFKYTRHADQQSLVVVAASDKQHSNHATENKYRCLFLGQNDCVYELLLTEKPTLDDDDGNFKYLLCYM